MNKGIIFLLLIFVSVSSFAQPEKKAIQKFYGSFGGGVTSRDGALASLGLRAILSNNWTFGLSYDNTNMNPKNLPADYRPGVFLLLIIPISEGNPSVDMNMFSVTAGKYFPVGRRVWFTTDAGLSLVSGKEFQFRPNTDRGGLLDFPSNYTYTEMRKTSVGGLLQAEVHWAFLNFAGLSAGAFANINGIQSPVGASLKLIIGKMGVKAQQR